MCEQLSETVSKNSSLHILSERTQKPVIMNRTCKFSNVTNDYLAFYDGILCDMKNGMTHADLSDSISHNFITQMIPHHQGAIEMSRNLLRYTTCIPLQNLALQIITEQTRSISDMQGILCRCDSLHNCREDLCCFQTRTRKIMQTMFCEMKQACTTNCVHCNFIREMIPHHCGAVAMSENTLRYCICPELVPILDAIIRSQKQEVQNMQCMLRCLCC